MNKTTGSKKINLLACVIYDVKSNNLVNGVFKCINFVLPTFTQSVINSLQA